MFTGTVDLRAEIKGNGLTFAAFDFDPKESGVEKVRLEGPNGEQILITVSFTSVASPDEGKQRAMELGTKALDCVTYHHGIVLEDARITGHHFSPVNPPAGPHLVAGSGSLFISGHAAKMVLGLNPAALKVELEDPSPPGERNFALFRSALLSGSPVEAFMHLYNLLLMIYNDSQADLDAFVVGQNPALPQTQHPKKKPGAMETIYTRLRNEFAHVRAGVNISTTKSAMSNYLGELRDLTKKAIELNP